jgi:hypothetical protein
MGSFDLSYTGKENEGGKKKRGRKLCQYPMILYVRALMIEEEKEKRKGHYESRTHQSFRK